MIDGSVVAFRAFRRSLAGLLLALSIGGETARGETCSADGAPDRVAAVGDDLDLLMDGGRELRLAGIDPVRATAASPAAAADARAVLTAWLSGRAVRVAALAASPDRWDRTPALVWPDDGRPVAPDGDARASVAEALLGAGLGRVKPDSLPGGCVAALLGVERRARATSLGLWRDPYYALLHADDRDGLARRTGSMALVEGTLRIGQARTGTYLRLGPGRDGFAAWLSRRAAASLAKTGLDVAALKGRRVRIRGFLDDRFGPRIDVTSGDQIETLGDAAPGDAAPGGAAPSGPTDH